LVFPEPPPALMLLPEQREKHTDGEQLSQMVQVVANNYGICRRTDNQLEGLQEWIRHQQALSRASE